MNCQPHGQDHAPSISVIIPARNEEQYLGRTLMSLRPAGVGQVIVVDGRSADRTVQIAQEAGVTVVTSPAGRAVQMNAGAAVARGDVLLFLHADTLLPDDFVIHITRVLRQPNVVAGAFNLRIGGPQLAFRVIENLVRWRCQWRQLPYGDQALFVWTKVFRQLGCYRPLPIMEDFDLVCRLRRRGRIAMADATAVTSSRRWVDRGIFKTTLINQLCLAAYRCGVRPSRIAAWRY